MHVIETLKSKYKKYKTMSEKPHYKTRRTLYRYIKIMCAITLVTLILSVYAVHSGDGGMSAIVFSITFFALFFYLIAAGYGFLSLRIRKIEELFESELQRRKEKDAKSDNSN